MNVTATAGSLQLRMPPANHASVGQDALIRNVGANTFTIADYTGGVIGSLKSIGFQIREFNPTRCIVTFDGKNVISICIFF
jgi:hypothetical protein